MNRSFGLRWEPRSHVLGWDSDTHTGKNNLDGEKGPGKDMPGHMKKKKKFIKM